MLPLKDQAVLKEYVREQEASPAQPYERQGRPIYESQGFGRMMKGVGFVKLTDFGLAVCGDPSQKHYHDIQLWITPLPKSC